MAEINAIMHVKNATDYDTINLQTNSKIVNFDNSDTDLLATKVEEAIKEINTKVGSANEILNNI